MKVSIKNTHSWRLVRCLVPVLVTLCTFGVNAEPDTDILNEQLMQQPVLSVIVSTITDSLDKPWGMDFLPDGQLLLTEKGGALKRVDPETGVATQITGVPVSADIGQGGMMDVLVHPDFVNNGWIYLSYTVADEHRNASTRVSRARLVNNELTELQVLITAEPFFKERRHFGSRLLLDDGYLYITIGDRGNRQLAQRLDTLNGKVLRLTEEGAIPLDNPFVGRKEARAEIWTYGHRNPQGMARHPVTGAIWVVEHGPQGGDEINILKAGANYGWPLVSYGEEYGGGKIGEGTHKEGTEQPVIYWVPSIGASGMAFYQASHYPGWQPSLLVGSLKFARLNRLQLSDGGLGAETTLMADLGMRIRDVQTGPDGRIYLLAGDSSLIRLDAVVVDS